MSAYLNTIGTRVSNRLVLEVYPMGGPVENLT